MHDLMALHITYCMLGKDPKAITHVQEAVLKMFHLQTHILEWELALT